MTEVTITPSSDTDDRESGFEISGIKCDNPECNYQDMEVPFEYYPHYIDAPCPFCGWSLLSRLEYNQCVQKYIMMWYVESAMEYLKWFNPLHYWRLMFGDKRKRYNITIR